MSLNPWTRHQVEQLIEEYKQHPILYCVNNRYYHNRKLRAAALGEILKKIKAVRPETRDIDITKKINGLRTSYGHERRKQLKSIKDTGDASEIYKPALWYYDSLSFLNANIVSRDKSRDETDVKSPQMEFSDEIALESAGYHSMSASDPLSEAEAESESKFCFEEPPPKKKREDGDKIRGEYSSDRDDDGWLYYVSTLLAQIGDKQAKVLLRHKITKLLYDEIEKQFEFENTQC